MIIFPALKISGRVVKGKRTDNHMTLGARIGVKNPTEDTRGFTPDGKQFLTRFQAIGFLKKHDRDTYNKLPKEAQQGLHSEHLAQAYGIKQEVVNERHDAAPGRLDVSHAKREEQEVASGNGVGTGRTSESKGGAETFKPNDVQSDGGGATAKSSGHNTIQSKTAIVYDRGGLYLYCAEKLAETYKKVMYYLADADAYPTSQKHTIGAGIPKVKRIHDFWRHLGEADIVYFFDCYDGELQHWLRSKGYTVFGSGRGEQVEIDKIKFLELLEELKLPCPKTYLAEGMDDLCEYLKKYDGETLFLKNLHRGDFESRKFTSMAQSRPFLNDLKKRLGSASDALEVLVQHKIDAACEAGYDGFQVDGQYTDNCIVGYEIKDRGFVGKVFDEPPQIIKGVNDAFSETFRKLGYRGNYSTELRITKEGIPYYIDATCRTASPPGEIMCELYGNWANATWDIAKGLLPVLEPKAKYCAEVILTSDWHNEHELHVKFPPKYKSNIKLKNYTIRDGEYYCIPNGNGAFFGAVVTYGDTLKEAIKECCNIAKTIEADEFHFDDSMFEEACEQIEAGEKFGINY